MAMDWVSPRLGAGRSASAAQMPTIPMWRSIVARLEDEILTGRRPPGSPMPGEVELGRRFETSRATAAHALEYLARRGLVKRFQGRGTFVAAPQQYPDVALLATQAIEFTAVGEEGSHPVREFAATAAGRVVARLAVAAGGFWLPAVADLTVASLLGPPLVAGMSRFLSLCASERPEFDGATLRASIAVRDEFHGQTAKAVSLLHPGFFTMTWNVTPAG